MKRSEMLKRLHKFLFTMTMPGFENYTLDQKAERLLEIVEEAGMKPPSTRNPRLPSGMSFVEHTYEKTLDDLHDRKATVPQHYYVNEWEPENE